MAGVDGNIDQVLSAGLGGELALFGVLALQYTISAMASEPDRAWPLVAPTALPVASDGPRVTHT